MGLSKKISYTFERIQSKKKRKPVEQEFDWSNFEIIKRISYNYGFAIHIKYADCNNYEGEKILLYKGDFLTLKKQKYIDPHFSENKRYMSPIARFEPTKTGWKLAIHLLQTLDLINSL